MYRFTVDPNFETEIREFLKRNSYSTNPEKPNKFVKKDNTSSVEIILNKNILCSIRVTTDNQKEIFKFHKFLMKIHHIESNFVKDDIKEPKVAITIKSENHYGFYFNYLLGELFCEVLKQKNIHFSIARITINAFRCLDSIPIWVTKSDIKKIIKIIGDGPLKTYHIEELIHNILAEI